MALSESPTKVERNDKSDFEMKMTQTTIEELKLVKQDLEKELNTTRDKLASIQKAREKLRQDLTALSASEEKGISFFNKYSQVIKIRYLDKDGVFDQKAEISQKDVNTINSIYNHYLHGQPLQGKTTAELALKQIEKGTESIQQLLLVHSKPDVTNNSDLAILSKDEETVQKRSKVIQDLLAKFDAPNTDAQGTASPKPQK
jgi:chromosome segregation ATPase